MRRLLCPWTGISDVQIMLPDDEILSVPEEQRNNFAEMTLELVSWKSL